MQTVLQIFYPVVHQKLSYTSTLLASMLGFYSSTDKIIRITFTVSVSVIHCWSCSSTNHNPALCPPPPLPSVHSVTQSIQCVCVSMRHVCTSSSAQQTHRDTHRQRQTNRQQQEASQSVAVMRPPVASGDIYRIQYDTTRYDSRV